MYTRLVALLALAGCLGVAGSACSTTTAPATPDYAYYGGDDLGGGGRDLNALRDGAAPPDVGTLSRCGRPGDTGDDLGIGAFCTSLAACQMTAAPICAALDDPTLQFCTRSCDADGGGDPPCGAEAACVESQRLGYRICMPRRCLAPSDGGAGEPDGGAGGADGGAGDLGN